MSNLQKYITKRKKKDKEFAEDYDEGFEIFKLNKSFTERAEKGDWEKAREVLAKVPDVESEDYDKL
jgi:hypothetical protein